MLRQYLKNGWENVTQFGLKTVPKYIKQAHVGLLRATPIIKNANKFIQGLNTGTQKSQHFSPSAKSNMKQFAEFSTNFDDTIEKVTAKTGLIHDILMS